MCIRDSPCTVFRPHLLDQNTYDPVDEALAAKMHKAIAVIQFKLEGQLYRRHPEYGIDVYKRQARSRPCPRRFAASAFFEGGEKGEAAMAFRIEKMTPATWRGKGLAHYQAWQETYRGLMPDAYPVSYTHLFCQLTQICNRTDLHMQPPFFIFMGF